MAAATFTIQASDRGAEAAIVDAAVGGAVDGSSSAAFVEALEALIAAAPGAKRLRLDCAGLRYLSSSAIGAIIALLERLRKDGVELSLADVPKSLREILDIMGVAAYMNIE
jgi:anti-sigma B factor antagonist